MESMLPIPPYSQILKELLARLHDDLDHQTRTRLAGPGPDELDQYLLDINTYYYESFHNHFMPRYQQAIDDELRRIQGLSRQDETIRVNLVATLRLLSRLFNQTKNAIRQLHDQQRQANSHLLSLRTGLEACNVDLMYLLKEHAEVWVEFRGQVDIGRTLAADQQLRSTLERFPAVSLVVSLFRTWRPESSRDKRDFNRLLALWQLGLRLLMQIQESAPSAKDRLDNQLEEMEKIDAGWDNRKVLPAVRKWYKSHLQPTYHLYLEVLRGSAARNDQRRTLRAAVQFHDWLQAWLRTMEYGLDFCERGWDGWIDRFPALVGLEEDYGLAWADYGQRGLQSIDEMISGLSTGREGSYRPFSDRTGQILTDAHRYLTQSLAAHPNMTGPLLPSVERLGAEIELALRGVEIIDQRESQILAEIAAYRSISTVMESELVTLLSASQEVERLLDNRFLRYHFEDMDIEVEHLPIQPGTPFPANCAHLLGCPPIETQIGEAAPGTVIHAEGDLFIIRQGERVYQEVPRIIVAGKG